jgi:phenylpyruvate tautomerase PptA (4-oxalocrotonate tautomerase family)
MPIFEVDFVGPVYDNVRRVLARRIADAAATVLGSPPRSTWVRVRFVTADEYAENEGAEPGVFPVIVKVLEADPPHGDDLAAEAARLTEAIAAACARPAENVHLLYDPPGRGRVAFGGQLQV